MKCVITGGSGFIGGFIAEKLAKEGEEVIIYDVVEPKFSLGKNIVYIKGDTRFSKNLQRVVKNSDEVYDMAGLLGTSELMFINKRAVNTNIIGAINVLEVCRKEKVKRLFYPTKVNGWLNTYSITKFAIEQFHCMFKKNFNINTVVLRLFNVYGPREELYPVRKVAPLFIAQALNNKPIEIYGDGKQTVDLIYVEDVARIIINATKNYRLDNILDVGSGTPITVNDLAKKIIKITNSKSEIVYKKMRIGEPLRSNIKANMAKSKKYLNIGKLIDLDNGLKRTIKYYKSLDAEELNKALRYFKNRNKN